LTVSNASSFLTVGAYYFEKSLYCVEVIGVFSRRPYCSEVSWVWYVA